MTPSRIKTFVLAVVALLLGSCGVSAPEPSTCGSVSNSGGVRGVVAINSDYFSTNVALLSIDGQTITSSLVHSGSQRPGLSTTLSGDVVLPSSLSRSGHVVLLDSTQSVVTWIDPSGCEIKGQLSVGNRFRSNPRDYLEINASLAYIARYDLNPNLSAPEIDRGDDILIVDYNKRLLVGQIGFTTLFNNEARARPIRLVKTQDSVVALLQAFLGSGYNDALEGRLVFIDPSTHKIENVTIIPNFRNCGGMVATDEEIAVVCTGVLAKSSDAQLAESGLVALKRKGNQWIETFRVTAKSIGQGPLGFGLTNTPNEWIVQTGFWGYQSDPKGVWLAINKETKETRSIGLEQKAFDLGNLVCSNSRCYGADASPTGGVRVFVAHQNMSAERTWSEDPFRLPTRQVGFF